MKSGTTINYNDSDHEVDTDEVAGAFGEMEINVNAIESQSEGIENIARSDTTEELARVDIEYLKTVVVNESSIEMIKDKLVSTAEYRSKMLDDKQTDLRIEFPYFFTHADLVINQACVYVCACACMCMCGLARLSVLGRARVCVCVLPTKFHIRTTPTCVGPYASVLDSYGLASYEKIFALELLLYIYIFQF